MGHYASLSMVKEKLRIPATDSSINDELNIYIDEIDAMINRRLRARFGNETEYGYQVELPLTDTTNPARTYDLRVVATDLVEGKFRLKTTEDNTMWNESQTRLESYLDQTYGWVEGHAYRRSPTITLSPTNGSAGTTITMTGTGFKPRGQIEIKIVDANGNGAIKTTTPTTVLTDDSGDFSSVTFATLSTDAVGSYEILAHDKVNHSKRNFTVTS
jgi:hypothetical protein